MKIYRLPSFSRSPLLSHLISIHFSLQTRRAQLQCALMHAALSSLQERVKKIQEKKSCSSWRAGKFVADNEKQCRQRRRRWITSSNDANKAWLLMTTFVKKFQSFVERGRRDNLCVNERKEPRSCSLIILTSYEKQAASSFYCIISMMGSL